MKRNDIILIVALLILGMAGFFFYLMRVQQPGSVVIITVDSKEYGRYDLKKDQMIPINDMNTVEIKDGKVRMIEADCPDKICVNHRVVEYNGESIVCLPNKVLVEVKSEENSSLDAVTG
jgi:hypothetical protein